MLIANVVRPDLIYRTGVIEPFSPQQPVHQAQGQPGGFINEVRPPGPQTISPQPASQVASAARAVAAQFAQGKAAKVKVGSVTKTLRPGQAATGDVFGRIVSAARHLAKGQAVSITAQGQSVAVTPPPQAQGRRRR